MKLKFNPKELYMMDDDILIRVSEFKKYVDKDNKPDYEGFMINTHNGYFSRHHMGKCKDDKINSSPIYVPKCNYCSGAFYFLGSKAIDILSFTYDFDLNFFDDVWKGLLLEKNEIYPTHNPHIYTDNLHHFISNQDMIGFHDHKHLFSFTGLNNHFKIN